MCEREVEHWLDALSFSSGHGQALLTFLYDVAREREGVFEITVEDPAPGFEKVRDESQPMLSSDV